VATEYKDIYESKIVFLLTCFENFEDGEVRRR
jgi:hypothetical protein